MTTASKFRDKFLASITVGYDWLSSAHYADICISDNAGVAATYRIDGLSTYYLNEDFGAQYIERCTLLVTPSRVYASLGPHTEGVESDLDTLVFVGSGISAIAATG